MTKPVSHPSSSNQWPIVGSIGLFLIALGIINWLHHHSIAGSIIFFVGTLIFIYMLFGWFGSVIQESQAGLYNEEGIHRSFRTAMLWFIFTELMFFGAFFGAFFYARLISVPLLGGHGTSVMTHYLLWPGFTATWPIYHPPNPTQFAGPKGIMDVWGIPALNTLILIASDMIITWGFWELLRKKTRRLIWAQAITIVLAVIFVILQIYEYGSAYKNLSLKLSSGIYGATFYMLTGVHGMHVIVGIIMLTVIMIRTIQGHFNAKHNFAVAALTWYWHFIDILWFILFIFVYWW